MTLRYHSGHEVKKGDRIRYHGEPAVVNFVVIERTGDPSVDWYMDEFPEGGCMLEASAFGHVFVPSTDLHDHAQFLSRIDDGTSP